MPLADDDRKKGARTKRERTRQALMIAYGRLLWDWNFAEGTTPTGHLPTMKEVAEEAGVSLATAHRHFTIGALHTAVATALTHTSEQPEASKDIMAGLLEPYIKSRSGRALREHLNHELEHGSLSAQDCANVIFDILMGKMRQIDIKPSSYDWSELGAHLREAGWPDAPDRDVVQDAFVVARSMLAAAAEEAQEA